MKQHIITNVRQNNPLIHHLTNQVVMNFTANGLLAFGGSPIMAKAKDEAHDMASLADGLLINIGTLTADVLPAMIIAGQAANKKDIPVVIDPVGVAATPFRTAAIESILSKVQPTAIKGNAGEMAHLVNITWGSKGVESLHNNKGNIEEIALKVADKYQTTAVITGEIDIICTGNTLITNNLGTPLLTKITGAGCLLGSILAACLTTNDEPLDQAVTAVTFYSLAAEHAASSKYVSGPGTFLPQFIDALSMDVSELERS